MRTKTPADGNPDRGSPLEPPAIAAAPVPILALTGGRVTAANDAACDLFQAAAPAALTGRRFTDLLQAEHCAANDLGTPPDGPRRWSDGWTTATAHTLQGERFQVLVRAAPTGAVADGSDTSLIALAPLFDGGEPRAQQHEKESSRDQIAKLFANLAHEMRTPLNAVIGFGEIMSGAHFGPLDRRYAGYARDIVRAAYHLLGLVNGALDLGRASAGPGSLTMRPVELKAILNAALALVERDAITKSMSIGMPDLHALPVIHADETRLLQVIVNLLTNAIKYSPRGRHIAVTYSRERDEEIRIDVRDDGNGMTADEIGIALLPFGRTESALRAGESGTGLGLPITRAIVEAHGGRLTLQSAPHRGTTVSVILPASLIVAEPGIGGFLSQL